MCRVLSSSGEGALLVDIQIETHSQASQASQACTYSHADLSASKGRYGCRT